MFKNGKSIKKLEKQKSTRLVNPENENQKWYEKFQELWQQVEEKIEVNFAIFTSQTDFDFFASF